MLAPSEETRRKMSASARKKFLENPELRENLSKHVSERNRSEEVRKRHSEIMKQKYKHDSSFKDHMTKMRNTFQLTDETVLKRKTGLLKHIENHPEKFRKVYVFDKTRKLIETFTKLADAERAGYNRRSVVRCIKSGKLFKKAVYFSYSSALPLGTTAHAGDVGCL